MSDQPASSPPPPGATLLSDDSYSDGDSCDDCSFGDYVNHEEEYDRCLIVRLWDAARAGDIDVLRDAIRLAQAEGMSMDESDEDGETALHMAADRGSVACVLLLLNAGADANAVDLCGMSVLQAAVIGGDANCVRVLLRADADPDRTDDDGDSPRSCAEDEGDPAVKAEFQRNELRKRMRDNRIVEVDEEGEDV